MLDIAQCDLFITRNGKHDLNCIKVCDCKEYHPTAKNAHLFLSKTKIMSTIPFATGGFGGLSTPKQSTKPLKLKHERLLHQWSFFHQFFNVKPSLLKTFWRRFCMWNAALKTGNLTSRIVRCALSAQ